MNKLLINTNATIESALKKLKNTGKRCLVVINHNRQVLGTLTDGDIRKNLIKYKSLSNTIEKAYNKSPVLFKKSDLNNKHLFYKYFIKKKIELIPLVDSSKKFIRSISYLDYYNLKKNKSSKKKEHNIPVVIMAGGKGTRLKPFTDILPKPLMPIHNKTVIEHIIRKFIENKCSKFYITINHKSEILKAYFNELEYFKRLIAENKIIFIKEKKELGTVGSLKLIPKISNNFILSNCDSLYNFKISKSIDYHIKNGFDLTIVISKKNIQIPYGICEVDNNLLKNIEEKPRFNFLANTGLYLMKKIILKYIPKNKKFDINELISILLENNLRIGVFKINNKNWFDTGEWGQLKSTIDKLKSD
jgi:dTDP-glucose pyrophosphorylase